MSNQVEELTFLSEIEPGEKIDVFEQIRCPSSCNIATATSYEFDFRGKKSAIGPNTAILTNIQQGYTFYPQYIVDHTVRLHTSQKCDLWSCFCVTNVDFTRNLPGS